MNAAAFLVPKGIKMPNGRVAIAETMGEDINDNLDNFFKAMREVTIVEVVQRPSLVSVLKALGELQAAVARRDDVDAAMEQAETVLKAYGRPVEHSARGFNP